MLIKTSTRGLSAEEVGMLTPALIMRGDKQVTVFDFDRTKHGTKRQVPLGKMRPDVGKVTATGKAKQRNPHYNTRCFGSQTLSRFCQRA